MREGGVPFIGFWKTSRWGYQTRLVNRSTILSDQLVTPQLAQGTL
jgi:hypothetical protein